MVLTEFKITITIVRNRYFKLSENQALKIFLIFSFDKMFSDSEEESHVAAVTYVPQFSL